MLGWGLTRLVDHASWEPTYEEILAAFGYDPKADRTAARELDRLLEDRRKLAESRLRLLFRDRHVVVFGGAPHLEEDAATFGAYQGTLVATDGSLQRLDEAGVVPDLVVTDLDKTADLQVRASDDGVPVVVHAHGDNRDRLKAWVPRLDGPVMGTCQCDPEGLDRVRSFGGFTDGDRAACMAAHFGARRLLLVGWDFEAARGDKLEKLRFAERIVDDLPVPVDVL